MVLVIQLGWTFRTRFLGVQPFPDHFHFSAQTGYFVVTGLVRGHGLFQRSDFGLYVIDVALLSSLGALIG